MVACCHLVGRNFKFELRFSDWTTNDWGYCVVLHLTANFKAGFHTCVSRMHNGARCLSMYGHHCSQAIPAFAISLRARNKVAHVELLRGLCRDMLWLWPVGTDNAGHKKIFCLPKKEQSSEQKKYNAFRKVVISNSILDALRNLHTSKYKKKLIINMTMVAYGNRQNAITFARANNSDLFRALKHLMETRLYLFYKNMTLYLC